MRLILLGPPGAGKGTQARRIVGRFGGVHVATGEILRANAERGTDLGREARRYMDRGDLVPDELVVGMMLTRLDEPDAAGFVLDGFPRTQAQAKALDRHLDEVGRPLDAVLSLEIGEQELRRRLAGRAAEQDRADDEHERAVTRRLQVFASETAPLVAYYQDRGLLLRIDAEGTMDEVTEQIARALTDRQGAA
ncbi:MAG TPA: adenylate kinase [Actinomycetes bacterium]|jgi:adenylate kinase|nr:adenylate kinase [Actinomycetes bacterium]